MTWGHLHLSYSFSRCFSPKQPTVQMCIRSLCVIPGSQIFTLLLITLFNLLLSSCNLTLYTLYVFTCTCILVYLQTFPSYDTALPEVLHRLMFILAVLHSLAILQYAPPVRFMVQLLPISVGSVETPFFPSAQCCCKSITWTWYRS